MKKNSKNKGIFWLLFIILGGFIFKLLSFLFKNKKEIKHNLDDFFKDEIKEVDELVEGKEDFNTFCKDSFCIFKDYFIPSHSNDHKPKILRTKSLAIIAILLVIIKLSITAYLFFLYPNKAIMTNVIISRVYTLINIDRQENSLPPLALNLLLNNSAQAKADDMAVNDYFAHESPDGRKPWDWISRSDYPYLFVGENLAMNFNSADAVHNALMLSPTHKKNILNDKFNEVGLAMTSGIINGKETNLLVQLFAYRKIEIAPLAVETNQKDKVVEVEVQSPKLNTTGTVEVAGVDENVNEPNDLEEIYEENINEDLLETETLNPEPSAEINASVISEEILAEISNDLEFYEQFMYEEQAMFEEIAIESDMENNQFEEELALTNKDEETALLGTENFDTDLNTKINYFDTQSDSQFEIAAFLIKISRYVYLVVLIFIIAALLVNIFIRASIQHKSVIVQSILLIIFIIGLISVHLHILESIVNGVAIV